VFGRNVPYHQATIPAWRDSFALYFIGHLHVYIVLSVSLKVNWIKFCPCKTCKGVEELSLVCVSVILSHQSIKCVHCCNPRI
jgi:hypothetical protein